jgi:hypothetical protein
MISGHSGIYLLHAFMSVASAQLIITISDKAENWEVPVRRTITTFRRASDGAEAKALGGVETPVIAVPQHGIIMNSAAIWQATFKPSLRYSIALIRPRNSRARPLALLGPPTVTSRATPLLAAILVSWPSR